MEYNKLTKIGHAGKQNEYNYMLFFSANPDDKIEAEFIHNELQTKIGLKGVICPETAFVTDRTCGLIQFKRTSDIVFFLLTDNLSATIFQNKALWDELSNTDREIIPILLTEKNKLKPRDNPLFAWLMSRVAINIKNNSFHEKLHKLKRKFDGKRDDVCGHSAFGHDPEKNNAHEKLASRPAALDLTGVNGNGKIACAQGGECDIETDGATSPAERPGQIDHSYYVGPGTSGVTLAHQVSKPDCCSGSCVGTDCARHPQFLLRLMQAFNKCQLDDVVHLTSLLHENGILSNREKDQIQRITTCEKDLKDQLLVMLLCKEAVLANDGWLNLMLTTCTIRTEYRHTRNVHQTTLRILGTLLEYKIQNTHGVIDGVFAGMILGQYECDELFGLLNNQKQGKANQRLIQILKQKDESAIKISLNIIKGHVSATCRNHVEHTLEALHDGKSPPECCASLEYVSLGQIEHVMTGPYQRRIKRCFKDIVDHIDIDDVVDTLFSSDVISFDQLERLPNVQQPRSDRARKLVMEIYKQDETHAVKFVNILKNSTGSNPKIADLIQSGVTT